jgi:putative transposase
MRYALVASERGCLPIQRACTLLKVSVSGYYAWKQQQTRPVSKEQDPLIPPIKALFEESRGTYGSPRITAALRQLGYRCNRKRVARLMRAQHLVAKHRGRRRMKTTDSRHDLPIAPNLLQRDFSADHPNQKWVADITFIDTHEGWLYLALVLDVFSRRIVGWAMDIHMETSLVEQAFRMALVQRHPLSGDLLHHSDRGGQYASHLYQQLLNVYGITASMSRTADPYDNALMESCIGTLKTECADHVFASRQVARTELFTYLEGWYNRRRLHSSLGYLSPDQFEHRFLLDNDSFHFKG